MIVYSYKIMQYHWFLKSFSNYINTNYVRLGISSDQKDAIVLLWTNWVPKMNAYTDPNTYGSISITDINALYIATKFITTGVQGQVSSNPSVTLTGADYANLGIAKPKAHRTHVPAVRFAPIGDGSLSFCSFKTPIILFGSSRGRTIYALLKLPP